MVDFKIEGSCYVNDKFIGTTVAKKITVNILNPDNDINLENKEITVQTGLVINGEEEIVPFGNFIIEKPDTEEVKQKTNFTGYDYMIKFNVLYKDRVIYPIPLGEYFEDLCNQVGLEAGNIDFINSNYIVLGNPFTNNEDCKTVLSNIAQLAGGFAYIGRDNKVYIKTLKNTSKLLKVRDVNEMPVREFNLALVKMLISSRQNTDERLDGNNYLEDFSKNNVWGEVNSLILRISGIEGENTTIEDEASIEKNGLTEIIIEDNYFLNNQSEREKVITPLWNILEGIKYLPFKTEYYGYPYLDAGDMIYVQDTKDKGYVSYVFNYSFTFNGGYSGSLETKALTKTQTAYKNTGNGKTKFRQVERKVDKINGQIQDIIIQQTQTETKLEDTNELIDTINENVANLTIEKDNISATVSETITRLDNDYMTTEQIEAENQTMKDDLDIIKQQQASMELTSSGLQVQIDEINNNGVSVVKNTTVNIDEKGVTVGKSDSEFSTTMSNTGTYMYSYDKQIAKYDKDGAEMYNLTVQNEAILGYLRFIRAEVGGEKRTHIHWIGG